MDSKIEAIYKMIKEIKNEMIGKDLIKKIIMEAIDEELDRVRQEIQTWKEAELESLVSDTIKREIKKVTDTLPMVGASGQEAGKKKSYSEAASKKQEAVIIIKPLEENVASSSEDTKRDIKNKIDITKLGVGITKMKKVTRGAVVVGCEDKRQADKLKEKVTKDLGKKYIIQTPMKKKLKIRIFDVDKEDSENEQDFWGKIEDQNGFRKDSTAGKIIHKSTNEKMKKTTIVAEVNNETREKLLELGKVKIGWKICKIQEYIGILRCYKCCGYYHFAKDCNKKETCGKCAGQHATKECKSQEKKCVNCEDKIKNFKIKNLKADHSAYDNNCPYFKREIEKQKSKIYSSL